MKINGEAVYSSRPFEVFGENSVCYTRNKGNVYATLLDWNGETVTLKSLRAGGATLGKVSKVELLGSDVPLTFVQDERGLTITPQSKVLSLAAISDAALASNSRVLRITHDKGWFNDDDPGATARGWIRQCNLGTGDFNNDLTVSNTPGDIWKSSFSGTSVSVIAPKRREPAKSKSRSTEKAARRRIYRLRLVANRSKRCAKSADWLKENTSSASSIAAAGRWLLTQLLSIDPTE